MGKLIDLTGQKFGLWTVLGRAGLAYQPMWLCRCDCGETRNVSGANLRSGVSTNCGCARVHFTTHGHGKRGARTPTYRSWKAMHSRCKPNYKQAEDYFRRGIAVCARWNDFALFLSDLGERPEGMTLDRIDNDGDYEPGNCRWAAIPTQRRNSRRINPVELNGKTLPLKDATIGLGFSDSAVYRERKRKGGSVQEAFDRVYARAKARGFQRYAGFE